METIKNIVREMRECAADCTSHGCRDMDRFADRIEAAYKMNRSYQESKCAANEELAHKLTKQREINKELVDENSRLKAAAPELYDCLRESCEERCEDCICENCSMCIVSTKWRKALAKAGGEEAVKNGR